MAFGLIPALRASGTSPIEALKASSGRHTTRARLLRPLVATQLAFSLTVLFLASLLLASFARLARVDAGFVADGVTLISAALVHPQTGRTRPRCGADAGRPGPFAPRRDLRRACRGGRCSAARVERQVLVNGRRPNDTDVWFLEVSPGFIETMRIRLLAGRDLTRADFDPGSPSVRRQRDLRAAVPAGDPAPRRPVHPAGADDRTRAGTADPAAGRGTRRRREVQRPARAAPPTVYLPLRAPGRRRRFRQRRHARGPFGAAAGGGGRHRARRRPRVTPPMKVTGVSRNRRSSSTRCCVSGCSRCSRASSPSSASRWPQSGSTGC